MPGIFPNATTAEQRAINGLAQRCDAYESLIVLQNELIQNLELLAFEQLGAEDYIAASHDARTRMDSVLRGQLGR